MTPPAGLSLNRSPVHKSSLHVPSVLGTVPSAAVGMVPPTGDVVILSATTDVMTAPLVAGPTGKSTNDWLMAVQTEHSVHVPKVDSSPHPESKGGPGAPLGQGPCRRPRAVDGGRFTTTRVWGSKCITDPGGPPSPDKLTFPEQNPCVCVPGETAQ